jgi:hypothetical protein
MILFADAVLTIAPVTADVGAAHPAATWMLVEHYAGTAHVVTTDDQCLNGIDAAARAWAVSTDAAYCSRAAS